jgi:hypothetical protein
VTFAAPAAERSKHTEFSPRPESGGFRFHFAPRFPSAALRKTAALMPPRIRACHSAGKPLRFAYSPSCSGYEANVFAALALRVCAYAPGERSTSQLSG